jgi:hypothetical protein
MITNLVTFRCCNFLIHEVHRTALKVSTELHHFVLMSNSSIKEMIGYRFNYWQRR